MSDETVLNLFVSSPGDVQAERERVDFVIARLNAEYKGRAQIRAIRWETAYYSSHDTFQAQIPEAAASDLVLAIFGARLGSPLPESFPLMPSGEAYPSGSAYEVLSAMEARRRGQGVPDIYVFRRPRAPLVALDAADRDDVEAQWRRLTSFFETWFRNRGGQFLAAFQEFATTDEFALKVEDCLRQWLTRRGFPPRSVTWDRRKLGSPYPGLEAFDESRRRVFFGRSLVIEQAIQRLREVEAPATERGSPFLLLIGASGSGKSSLLRAGLLPRVAQPGALPEVDLWRRAIAVPGLDPFLNLAESLLLPEALGPELARGPFRTREILAKQLAGDPDAALAPLREALERAAAARQKEENFEAPRPARLFLAIDQAERLLLETPPDPRARFAQLLAALCRHRVATVVMALRSDAYARFQAVEALVALRDAGATLDLLPATASELEEMATRPAALCEPPLAFEQRDGRSLAATLVADARGGDALPLLQMTLARLSAAEAARGDGVLRFDDYHGLGEAVTQTANEALAGLDASARGQLPQLIAGLVLDVAADPLTGQPTPVIGALDRARFEAGRPERQALVEAFVGKRLLTAEGDASSERVRPTHESLLRIWPEAVAIVAEVGNLIRTRHALEPIAREWAEAPEADKTRHLEISPALLEGAQRYLDRFGDDAPLATRDFVAAASAVAQARRDRERQEQERRVADAEAIAAGNRRIAQRTGIGLVAALALAAAAGWEWRSSNIAQQEAQAQRDRATHALALATETSDRLVFQLADKFRNLAGVPKSVVKDILDQARDLQEQLIGSGETDARLSAGHAGALAEIAVTEQALGDAPTALKLARQSRDIYSTVLAGAPDNLAYIHNLVLADQTLGTVLQQQNDFDGAQDAFQHGRSVVEAAIARGLKASSLPGDQSTMIEDLGALARSRNDLPGALQLFRQALTIAKSVADAAPKDVSALNGLAIANRSVGDVLLAQNDTDGAVAAFDAASAIAGPLARDNPDNTVLQRDYSLSQERLGETLFAKHDYSGASKAFSDGEATAIAMAAKDPAELDWQADISIGHAEIGDTQMALQDFAGAVESYREAVTIDRSLTTSDPTNAIWRAHYWAVLTDLGDALAKHAEPAGALQAYRESLAIARSAAAAQPNDARWRQNGLASEDWVGDALEASGDHAGALAAYRDGLTMARALAADPQPSAEANDDLYANLFKVAGQLARTGDRAGALAAYREALAFAKTVVAAHPSDPKWRRNVLVSDDYVGDLLVAASDNDGSSAAYQDALTIARALAGQAGASDQARNDLFVNLEKVAGALSTKGDDAGALAADVEAEGVARTLIATNPKATATRGQLAVLLVGVGRLQSLAGRADDAIASLREAVDLAKAASAGDGAQPLWAREVATAYDGLGDALRAKGDLAGALDAYRQSVAADESLPAATKSAADLRFREAATQEAIGAVLQTQKDPAAALAAMRAALALRQGLAGEAPDDPEARRNQLVDQNKVGALLIAQGDKSGALAAYQAGLTVARGLAARAGADAKARADLAYSLFLVGTTAPAGDAASAALAEGLPIAQALAVGAPTTTRFQYLVVLLGRNLGYARLAAGDNTGALVAYVSARDAAAALVALNPKDAQAAAELKANVSGIGLVANAMLLAGDFQGALAALDKATPVATDQNWFDLIRAACLMFQGRRDEARALYERHRGETTYAGKSWEQATKDGFAALRAKGLDNTLMAEIEAKMAAGK
jgi:tetratricopeptide (TPR) repeat protein